MNVPARKWIEFCSSIRNVVLACAIAAPGISIKLPAPKPIMRMTSRRSISFMSMACLRCSDVGDDHVAVGVAFELLSGEQHRRRVHLFNNGRPLQPAVGAQCRTIINRAIDEAGLREMNAAHFFETRRGVHARGWKAEFRSVERGACGEAQRDEFDLGCGGVAI